MCASSSTQRSTAAEEMQLTIAQLQNYYKSNKIKNNDFPAISLAVSTVDFECHLVVAIIIILVFILCDSNETMEMTTKVDINLYLTL